MSFILEALRKSEQERRQGEVPGLGSEPPPPPPRRSSRLLVILVAALLLNGVLLGWWLLVPSNRDAADVSRQERPVAAANEAAATQAGPPAAPPQATGVGTETVATGGGEPGAAETAAPVSRTDAPSSAGKNPDRAPAVAAREAPGEPSRPAEPAAPSPTDPSGQLAVEPDAALPLSRLPANIRAGIPEIELQLHFFTRRPERRLVRLNGANLREGDSGPDGLLVEEINPRGVVLRHRGQRFFYSSERD